MPDIYRFYSLEGLQDVRTLEEVVAAAKTKETQLLLIHNLANYQKWNVNVNVADNGDR